MLFAFSFISVRPFFPTFLPCSPTLVVHAPRDPFQDSSPPVSHRPRVTSVLGSFSLTRSLSVHTVGVLSFLEMLGIFCILSSFGVFCQIISSTCARLFFENIHPLYFGFHFPPASLSLSFISSVSHFTTNAFSEISSMVYFELSCFSGVLGVSVVSFLEIVGSSFFTSFTLSGITATVFSYPHTIFES